VAASGGRDRADGRVPGPSCGPREPPGPLSSPGRCWSTASGWPPPAPAPPGPRLPVTVRSVSVRSVSVQLPSPPPSAPASALSCARADATSPPGISPRHHTSAASGPAAAASRLASGLDGCASASRARRSANSRYLLAARSAAPARRSPGVLLASGSTGLSGRSASARGLSGSRIGPIVPHLPPRRRGPAVPCRPSARNLGLVTSRSAIVRGRQGRAGGDGCQCAAAQRRSAGD